jgi:IrrE N-terminal-like domain
VSEDHYVQPLSKVEIEEKAYAWRDAFELSAHCAAPDMPSVLEISLPKRLPLISIQIMSDAEMNNVEAFTTFDPPTISIRESVYLAAATFDGRARMTLAHELGHLVLHKSAAPLNRAPERYKNADKLKPFASAEYQANAFGAAFLVPEWIACEFDDADALARHCCVSRKLAEIRLGAVKVRQPSPGDVVANRLVRDWTKS